MWVEDFVSRESSHVGYDVHTAVADGWSGLEDTNSGGSTLTVAHYARCHSC